MTATAVILAGGKGTRSADPARAKLAQQVAGRSLMEWHLEVLQRSEIAEVVVVAGHHGDQVQALVDELSWSSPDVRVIHEERQEGTVAALRLAADHVTGDEFVVLLGDVLMSLPLQDFIDQWRASGAGVAVAVHPSTHPLDSDTCFPSEDGRVEVIPKGQPRHHVPNMSAAGLFALNRESMHRYGRLCDLGSDVLLAAARDGDLLAFVTSHYLKDTGTASRLSDAEGDAARGAFDRRGDLRPRAALFLDRDGVINPTEPEMYRAEQYEILPGVAKAIGEANRAGVPVIVVTNQPHIAKGLMSFDDHQQVRARMDHLLHLDGAFVDDYLFCPHHPEAGFAGEVAALKTVCDCRKPRTGLALQAARRHRIDLSRSVMVGDTDRDRGLALATGMHYVSVHPVQADETQADGTAAGGSADPAAAIRQGLGVITC